MNRVVLAFFALLVSGLLTLASCATAPGTTPPSTTPKTSSPATAAPPPTTTTSPKTTTAAPQGAAAPQYGGTLVRALAAPPNSFLPIASNGITPQQLQELWGGDWTLGNAGGYGSKLTDWAQTIDRPDRKTGLIAEKTTWNVDASTNKATIVWKIRSGIRYQRVPNSAASSLVNGRELTADDVVFVLQTRVGNPKSSIYNANPELRNSVITKTGQWEVTGVVDAPSLLTALTRFNASAGFYPPEVFKQFNMMTDWPDQVGTGAFMLTNYVGGSSVTYTRNPDYWEKDPIGPGKGNQLPYLDGIRDLVIPDLSTRNSALRTGKIDAIASVTADDAKTLLSGTAAVSALKSLEKTSVDGRGYPMFLRVDQKPFDDIRVRQALMMATNFNDILANLYGGKGQIVTYPFPDTTDYHALYLGLNDSDAPAGMKDLYTYSPDKAKKLLAEAGYPNGLTTSILLTSSDPPAIDYYTLLASMWAKAGITLNIEIKENSVYTSVLASHTGYSTTYFATAPVSTFYLGGIFQGQGPNNNLGNLNDPIINKALDNVRAAASSDFNKAMQIYRNELAKYVVVQAFHIPAVIGYTYNIWWPWLPNYSGEGPISYAQTIWPNYVWKDQALKRSMGF
jgi:peptide/nickel transport system substrate-binding protein